MTAPANEPSPAESAIVPMDRAETGAPAATGPGPADRGRPSEAHRVQSKGQPAKETAPDGSPAPNLRTEPPQPATAPTADQPGRSVAEIKPDQAEKLGAMADMDIKALADAGQPDTFQSAPTAHALTTTQRAQAPGLPSHIPSDIAHLALRFAGQETEMTLAPEELGRVKMKLHVQDGSLSLSLVAERPETLDLLRRNIDQLAREFRDLGYANLSFSFSQQGSGGSGREFRGPGPDAGPDSDTPASQQGPRPVPIHAASSRALDLRF